MNESMFQQTENSRTHQKSNGPQIDRRTNQRTPVEAVVDIDTETNFYTGFSEDISTGGIFIATYDTKEIGEKVQVRFRLPGKSRLIATQGLVRWVREFNEMQPDVIPGVGIQFEQLSVEDYNTIHEFVETRPTMFYVA